MHDTYILRDNTELVKSMKFQNRKRYEGMHDLRYLECAYGLRSNGFQNRKRYGGMHDINSEIAGLDKSRSMVSKP